MKVINYVFTNLVAVGCAAGITFGFCKLVMILV